MQKHVVGAACLVIDISKDIAEQSARGKVSTGGT